MAKVKRFGAFGGVFTPSILTILGVIMYLRLPWIVGQAGLLVTLSIILVAHIISGSTGLSVSSIATDKKVETGGTYYIISRSLGLPIGGTLGWALFVGLSFSVSLYLIGFAEVFLGYFGFEVNPDTIRIAGSIILFLVTILTFISTSLAIKTQYIILTAMALSLVSVFFGKHEFGPSVPQLHSIPGSLPWISLFAIFFPAVTGFEAGVSMSGDLKDPRKAIPLGTISAIITGLAVYVILAFFFSYNVKSELLVNDPNVLFKISLVKELVIAGILGATLSSALGSIMGAPRIMQAVAGDRIAPFFFSKGYGPSKEPRNALILTYLIAQAGILIGELNVIARIVTIFFIITYGFLNITYTIESWASSDFRPAFRIPRFVSIIGSLACIVVMIQLDILAMAGASLILIALFFYLKNKELNLQTGDTRASVWLSLVKTGLLKLTKNQNTSRNWRPNVILFSGGAGNRPHLIELVKALVGKLGIFTNFDLIEQPDKNLLFEKKARVSFETYGEHTDILTRKHVCNNIYDGIEMISRVYGFSGFEPNTILMGWAKNTRDPKKLEELLINLNKLDYNLTFLSYHNEYGFGEKKQIDLWWNGKGKNLSLALHLVRFITATPEWRRAGIRILALNPGGKNTDRYYSILKQILDNYRIRANIKVINNPEKSGIADIIRTESYEADLTIAELPDPVKNKITGVVNYANELAEKLKTCLFIHASSGFEEINIISEIPSNSKGKSVIASGNKPEASALHDIKLSDIDIVYNEVFNVTQILEKHTQQLFNDSLFTLPEKREIILDQIKNLTERALEKSGKIDTIKIQQEKQWEYLKILNDFSFHVQKQISTYVNDHLNYEKDIIVNGFSRYIMETENIANNLPRYIRLLFGVEDFKKLYSVNIFKRLTKAGIIFWLNLYGGKIRYKIKVLPVARYFLYYKRMDFYRQFLKEYTLHIIMNFASIRDYLTDAYETIENARSGKLTQQEIFTTREKLKEVISQIKNANPEFIYKQGHTLIHDLADDLENFSKIIESPRANSLSKKFRSSETKSIKLKDELSMAPDIWFQYVKNSVNRIYLDFTFLTLKNRITTKIEKLHQDITILVEGNILKNLSIFEKQVRSFHEKGEIIKQKGEIISPKSITKPDFDELFHSLFQEIHESVESLPEYMEITEDGLVEIIQSKDYEDVNEYIVSVGKTADFYICNELNDQLKRESVNLKNTLSLSVTAIKDLIKLANFSLTSGDNNLTDEVDISKAQKQQKTILENLLLHIRNEDQKLRKLIGELKTSFDSGLKKAFEPLSSAIIIKTSTGLNKKIRESDKRMHFRRFEKLKKTIKSKLTDQSVNLLYSQSEGILWAKRIEQSQEKTILHPGESINKILEKISPDRKIMEQLPFYYSSLFSGSSAIGEDFWVGMEEEVEKGSNAIKRFLNGTRGSLIITGERSSGKSSLSKYLANLHFSQDQIFYIRAPKESTAENNLFIHTLLKYTDGKYNPEYSMDMLPEKSVIIINDLELWWERKPSGIQVVEQIIQLTRDYGQKVLFILNVNIHALKIINQLSSLNTWAIDLIFCQPFDARKLKDMILLRHQAGGMKFILNKKPENEMSNWDYARLFNRIFHLSSGNPGYAINLWLAGIKKVSGNTLIMEKPFDKSITLPENMPREELLNILQFILHRRFSVKKLSEILQCDVTITEKSIRILRQKGIIIEKFPGIYSLQPALEIHLVKKLKSIELL